MKAKTGYEKITVKDYMEYYDCSERTAKRYRDTDRKLLGLHPGEPIRYRDLLQLQGGGRHLVATKVFHLR